MHTPLDSHLHSEECNRAINELLLCHAEKSKLAQSLGACNEVDKIMRRCMKQERLARQKDNADKAREERKARQDKMDKIIKSGKTPAEIIEEKIRQAKQAKE